MKGMDTLLDNNSLNSFAYNLYEICASMEEYPINLFPQYISYKSSYLDFH